MIFGKRLVQIVLCLFFALIFQMKTSAALSKKLITSSVSKKWKILRGHEKNIGNPWMHLIVSSTPDNTHLIKQIKKLNKITFYDAGVLILEGPLSELEKLNVPASWKQPNVVIDSKFFIELPKRKSIINQRDENVYYLAKKDFGLPNFWKKNPNWDGRGVLAGLIDDGIAVNLSGLQKTSQGYRKIIGHYSDSTYYHYRLLNINSDQVRSTPFTKSCSQKYPADSIWQGKVKTWDGLNNKGDLTQASVLQLKNKSILGPSTLICLDVNKNEKVDEFECAKSFNKTGEYGFWDIKNKIPFIAEFENDTGTLILNEVEELSDSHGEGVASVLGGHQIEGQFDGVAPGVQILDYDFREKSKEEDEYFYTMSSFLKKIDFLGQKGAEVINISYSFYFQNLLSQLMMKEALEALIKKYNFVLVFSAGNNGPGVGSLNRRMIYPENSLTVGAYIGRELDEYVHGVTGLPEKGGVIYYSSKGPGPLGQGPSLIGPLASLVHGSRPGHSRGFSGTSSAAPAVAGFACVLISALKSLNYKIDASLIVQAIILSAEQIPNVPTVFQGTGLPNIEKAVAIYKDLYENSGPMDISVKILKEGQNGNIEKKGLVYYIDSQQPLSTFPKEESITLQGIFSEEFNSKSKNIFETVTLEYSSPWLHGPKKLWINQGSSRFFLALDPSLADFKEKNFEEIKIISDRTKKIIKRIPVSIIQYHSLRDNKEFSFSPGVEDGQSRSIYLSSDIVGLQIKQKFIKNSGERIGFRFYNPSNVSVQRIFNLALREEIIVPITMSGLHQISYYKSKGTYLPVELESSVRPIKLKLAQGGIEREEPYLQIKSETKNVSQFTLRIIPSSIEIGQSFVVWKNSDTIKSNFSLRSFEQNVSGKIKVTVLPMKMSNIEYFQTSCALKIYTNEGNILRKAFSHEIGLHEGDQAERLEVNCLPFDHIDDDTERKNSFQIKVFFEEKDPKVLWEKKVIIRPGVNQWLVENKLNVNKVEVQVGELFYQEASEFVSIGQSIVY